MCFSKTGNLLSLLILFLAASPLVMASDVTLRQGLSCGGVRVDPDIDQEKETGESARGAGDTPEELQVHKTAQAGLKKVVIERPRLIAKLRYLERWTEDPLAIRNLLLFIDKTLQVSPVDITGGDLSDISREQKLAIWDQLGDFEIDFDEQGSTLDQPNIRGDIPGVAGGEEPVATFEVINEHLEQNADDFIVLFMSGHDDFELAPEKVDLLRSYIVRGGFLLADCCCGQSGFEKGFERLVKQMFPNQKLDVLSPTHPVYATLFDLQKMRFSGKDRPADGTPRLRGLQLGCRTALLFSPDDISCGWDGHMHGEYVKREIYFGDALKLGANVVAYALGYRKLGSHLSKGKTLEDSFEHGAGEITFAQLVYPGDFDPDPTGVFNLVEWLRSHHNMPLRAERILVDPDTDDLFEHPFLYLTGHGPITWSEDAGEAVGAYLREGGTIISDACCGDTAFDQSFRSWARQWFPNHKMRRFPSTHEVFSSYYKVRSVKYRPLGKRKVLELLLSDEDAEFDRIMIQSRAPHLEGVVYSDNIPLYYSRFDLACAWEGQPCLLCRGLTHEVEDSFRMAANIVVNILNS